MAASHAGDSARTQILDTVCDLAASQYGAHHALLLTGHFCQILSSLEKTGSCSVHAGKALGTLVWCHMLSDRTQCAEARDACAHYISRGPFTALGLGRGCASRLGRKICSLLHCLRRFLCMQVELAEEDGYPL